MAQMMSYAFVFLLFIENRHYFTPSKTSPFHAIVSFLSIHQIFTILL